jgi:coenzyme F420 hydrogenase subunit beta
MPKLTINGLELEVEPGTTVLEASQFLGIPIPTLCHDDGLTPYGACRLCLVEAGTPLRTKLQSACTLRAEEGLVVQTHSARVERARQLLLELYVATSPGADPLSAGGTGPAVVA